MAGFTALGLGFRVETLAFKQVVPTLGPNVCKCCLHWAIWIPRLRG